MVIFCSCSSKPDKSIVPHWTSELLGPLVKTQVTASELAVLKNLHAYAYLKLADLGYENFPFKDVIVPDTSFPSFSTTALLDSALVSATFSSGEMYFELFNEMDFDIKKGLKILITQGNKTLFQETLSTDLPPATGKFISSRIPLADLTLLPELTVQVNDLATQGSKTPVNIYDKKIGIAITVAGAEVRTVQLRPGTYTFSDTSAFNLNGRAVSTQSVSGVLNSYFKNQLEIAPQFQFYFLDDQLLLTDSLFDNLIPIAPSTSIQPETKLTTEYSSTRSQNIDKAKYIRSFMKVSSADTITLSSSNTMDVQVVGDLKINVNQ